MERLRIKKKQLRINKRILESCATKHTGLSTAWINYLKAFDSVSHEWILQTLRYIQDDSDNFHLSPTCFDKMDTSPFEKKII